jgi:hypothetical protein
VIFPGNFLLCGGVFRDIFNGLIEILNYYWVPWYAEICDTPDVR